MSNPYEEEKLAALKVNCLKELQPSIDKIQQMPLQEVIDISDFLANLSNGLSVICADNQPYAAMVMAASNYLLGVRSGALTLKGK